MKVWNQLKILCLLLSLIMLLPGCWDRREINDVAFVLGSALDKEENGQLRYSVIIPLPGQMGGASGGGGGTSGTKSYYIESDTGRTLREAWSKIQKRMPRQMYLAHRRIVIIGEQYARDGIQEVFDLLIRQPESRMSVYMIVAEGSALELLKAQPKMERFSAEAIRELAIEPGALPITLKNVTLWMGNKGADPVMLYMGTKQTAGEEDSKEIEIRGYAQFQGEKMVGIFNGDTIAGINWLKNRFTPHNITVELEKGHLINIEVFSGKTNIKSRIQHGVAHFDINIMANIRIFENTSLSSYKFTDARLMETKISEHIRNTLQATINQMQKEETDSAGLGMVLFREHPAEWKNKFQYNWKEHLRKAKFHFQINSEISDTGLIFQSLSERKMNK